jgi:hypothetical protein
MAGDRTGGGDARAGRDGANSPYPSETSGPLTLRSSSGVLMYSRIRECINDAQRYRVILFEVQKHVRRNYGGHCIGFMAPLAELAPLAIAAQSVFEPKRLAQAALLQTHRNCPVKRSRSAGQPERPRLSQVLSSSQ